ncbi:MAG: hypothetical protein AAF639_44340 [Chloroflexota bacterium]
MSVLERIKSVSEDGKDVLIDFGESQADETKQWVGVVIGAVGGGFALAVVGKALLGVMIILTATPVTVTAGAVGGGLLGWNIMRARLAEKDIQTDGEAVDAEDVSTEAVDNAQSTSQNEDSPSEDEKG